MNSVLINALERQNEVPIEFTLDLYRKLLAIFHIEERMKTFARQGKCSFVASSRGHEVTQAGITSLLRPAHDWFFTYYRSKGTAVGIGLPLADIFLGMLGREGDPDDRAGSARGEVASAEFGVRAHVPGAKSSYNMKANQERAAPCSRVE